MSLCFGCLQVLPADLLGLVLGYLDARSVTQLRETCHFFLLLEVSDRYWESVMRNEIGGDVSLVTLKEGVTWRDAVTSLWKEIKIDWWEVISDPYFYQTMSFLHLEEEAPEIFGVGPTSQRRSTRLLMDWESLFNSCEDHELVESLFEESSSIYEFISGIASFTFALPGNHRLRLCLSAEGFYFFLDQLDIGRIDGHHCMPALRWEECKRIVDYQTVKSPFTHDHLLVLIALLAYPTEEDIEEYRAMVGNAYLATGLISSETKVQEWRNALSPCPNWRYDEDVRAWVHQWGARHVRRNLESQQAQEILSLLES